MQKNLTEQLEKLTERCIDVISADELAARLGRPLRVKLGIDPSGPLLHLGHAVVLRKLREFQDAGHEAILIVGDFTAQIGDPTGLSAARKPRTAEQVRSDMRSYAQQAGLILDLNRATIRYNSEWLAGMTLADVIGLAGKITVARMLERDDFTKRFAGGSPIGLHEFLYPLTQGYDSVAIRADVELGGSEQLFNLMVGRRLQEEFGQAPQVCMTLPILEGTDGVQRMGKSLNNFIALQEEPEQMFGKVMSIPDSLIVRYFRLATTWSARDCDAIEARLSSGELAPRNAKMQLAGEIVALYHGRDAARDARDHFERTIVRKELPAEVPQYRLDEDAADVTLAKLLVLVGWAASNREAQRLIEQGAIKIDGERAGDGRRTGASWNGKVLQKGNHQFIRIVSA
jgi:tyrosyl-tRNA synthetase